MLESEIRRSPLARDEGPDDGMINMGTDPILHFIHNLETRCVCFSFKDREQERRYVASAAR